VEPAAENDVFVTSLWGEICKNKNLAIAHRSRVNCAHNTLRASKGSLLSVSNVCKVSLEDKLRIQTLREQKPGATITCGRHARSLPQAKKASTIAELQTYKPTCYKSNLNYRVGQIKRGQCRFFRRSKARFREFWCGSFWQVK